MTPPVWLKGPPKTRVFHLCFTGSYKVPWLGFARLEELQSNTQFLRSLGGVDVGTGGLTWDVGSHNCLRKNTLRPWTFGLVTGASNCTCTPRVRMVVSHAGMLLSSSKVQDMGASRTERGNPISSHRSNQSLKKTLQSGIIMAMAQKWLHTKPMFKGRREEHPFM